MKKRKRKRKSQLIRIILKQYKYMFIETEMKI